MIIHNQKLLLVTCLYDPVLTNPGLLSPLFERFSEEAFFQEVGPALLERGAIQLTMLTADILPLWQNDEAMAPAQTLVALNYIPRSQTVCTGFGGEVDEA
ncbi:MAG: hypothetical protein H6657_00045 [Ardenticatenaceae bacterium]|nr:hypothetical protein [Ardenticatenaceae bacterium]